MYKQTALHFWVWQIRHVFTSFKLLTYILSVVKIELQIKGYCDTNHSTCSRVVWIRCGFCEILKISVILISRERLQPIYKAVCRSYTFVLQRFTKKSLKIPKGQSEYVNRRRDNTKEKEKRTNNDLQNIHIKQKIE